MPIISDSFEDKQNPPEAQNGFSKFSAWKQKAVEIMIQDDELTKLLFYNTPDWNDKPDVPEEKRMALVDSQIFQYTFIDVLAQEKKSYIGIGVNNISLDEGFRRFSQQYISGMLYFHILCDRGIISTNVGCRHDLIIDRLYRLFTDNQKFGVGKIQMETAYERTVDNFSHGGYVVGFKFVEMKR